jgi:NTE family protein
MRYPVPLLLLAALTATACASVTGSCPQLPRQPEKVASFNPCSLPPLPPTSSTLQLQKQKDFDFRNLALEGGGVKGIAYIGALQQLEASGTLDSINGVAGTSAGAITAALFALRYTPKEIQWLTFNNIDFEKFEDGGLTGIIRLFRRFGWYKGDYFLHLMRCLVELKTGDQHSTFGDLKAKGFRDLHVFATDVSTGQSIEFSAGTTKDVEVARAVRMSMSIPLFFASVDFRYGSNKDVFVDGGVLHNYPIDAFDTIGPPASIDEHTLGLALSGPPTPRTQIDSLPRYSQSLFETLLDAQVIDLQTNPPDLDRTALIYDCGVPVTDFQIDQPTKCELVRAGYECTSRYLTFWKPPGQTPISNKALGRATRIDISDKCGPAWPIPGPQPLPKCIPPPKQ